MSPLPPVAAAVPSSQRRSPRRQASQQQLSAEAAAAAVAGQYAAVTPGEAAAEAAALKAAPATPFVCGVPSMPLQSPFTTSPEPLARKLDAEFGAASGERCRRVCHYLVNPIA